MPGFVRWLSSDDEGEEEDLIVSTSQPTIEPSLSQPIAQPAKRSHTIQELPSNPQPVKKAKRSKTTDVVTHLPRIGDFHYTQKDLKEANKVTRKKEEIYAEMELHITKDVFSLFQELSSDFQSRILPANYGPPIIFWKRNVTAIYDKERDIFIPCHPTKILEKTFVLYYLAADFVTKLDNGDLKADVLAASQEALSITPNEYHIIIMVEGYDQLLWKIKSFEQRKFKNQVLQGLNSQEQSRRRNTDAEMAKYPSSNQIEFLVNRTQIDLKVNIFTIRGRPESVMWLNSFTYIIGQSLYNKFERNESLANLGTVRSGVDTKATFLQSMKHFKLMTQPKVDILYVSHKSIYSIYSTLKSKGTLGKDTLKRNIVPPTVDQSMLKFFTSDDPDSVIN
ncbi:EME1 Crossover junction endonuclease EME1 [Candida maltosa Xu316]